MDWLSAVSNDLRDRGFSQTNVDVCLSILVETDSIPPLLNDDDWNFYANQCAEMTDRVEIGYCDPAGHLPLALAIRLKIYQREREGVSTEEIVNEGLRVVEHYSTLPPLPTRPRLANVPTRQASWH